MDCESALNSIEATVSLIHQKMTDTDDTPTERLLMETVANLKDLNLNVKACITELTKLNTTIGGA